MTKKTEKSAPIEAENTPQDDPVATLILEMAAAASRPIAPRDVAIAMWERHKRPSDRPDSWRRYMVAVRQQVIHLARQERLEILRKGKPVDPNDFKGLYRVRLPVAESGEDAE